MSVIGNKIRVYDLARELKQVPERIIEDLQQEGVEVDAPWNSITQEIADRIRSKYFPKVKVKQKRPIKVIKSHEKKTENDSTKPSQKQENNVRKTLVKSCSYCRKRIVAKKISEHEDKCLKNPKWIHFTKNQIMSSFNKITILHTPISDDLVKKSKRCSNDGCENSVGMTGDICYDCICSSK